MFDYLLKSFEEIHSSPKKSGETIFDICGFPHYENVISNVLAFYLDHNGNHHLNGLLAESLIEASGLSDSNLDTQFQVEREVRTESGGFIDLLLKNDSCCIVLENKIFAPLNNDLNDYIKYGKKQACDKTFGIVLSMWRLDLKHPEFVNVVYSDFTLIVRKNLGNYITRDSNQYVFLLIDLIDNLDSLNKGGISVNSEFVDFIRKNTESVERFGNELKLYHDDLRRIVKEVNAIVVELIEDSSIKQWPWRNLPELYDVAVTDFELENGISIAIDATVDALGWKFTIFIRKGSNIDFSLNERCISAGLGGNMEGNRFVLEDQLSLETDSSAVAQKIVELIGKLKLTKSAENEYEH